MIPKDVYLLDHVIDYKITNVEYLKKILYNLSMFLTISKPKEIWVTEELYEVLKKLIPDSVILMGDSQVCISGITAIVKIATEINYEDVSYGITADWKDEAGEHLGTILLDKILIERKDNMIYFIDKVKDGLSPANLKKVSIHKTFTEPEEYYIYDLCDINVLLKIVAVWFMQQPV